MYFKKYNLPIIIAVLAVMVLVWGMLVFQRRPSIHVTGKEQDKTYTIEWMGINSSMYHCI